MVVDVFNSFRHDPGFNKLVGEDYMIMEYKCPIETELFQLLTEMHIITYVMSGKKDWITPELTCSVGEGEALFIRKGVYTVRQYFDVDHCVLTFFLSDDFIRKFMREVGSVSGRAQRESRSAGLVKLDVNETLKYLFLSVYNYMKMVPDIPRSLVEIKFRELMYNIVLNPCHEELTHFFQSLTQSKGTALDQIMLKYFQHDLPLQDFARLCGRSLSAFKRDFLSHYHETPARWLKQKRLDYAAALLLSSDLGVKEVGYESGFVNASHFNKAFKEKFHVSPQQYRLRNAALKPV